MARDVHCTAFEPAFVPSPPLSLTGSRDPAAYIVGHEVDCAALEPAFRPSPQSSVTHLAVGPGRPQCHGTRCRRPAPGRGPGGRLPPVSLPTWQISTSHRHGYELPELTFSNRQPARAALSFALLLHYIGSHSTQVCSSQCTSVVSPDFI